MVAGLGVGIYATLPLGRVLANVLYGIRAADPAVLALVSAAMLAVAGFAILWPARPARVDPMIALRE